MKNYRKDLELEMMDLSERALEVKTKSTKLKESLLDKKGRAKKNVPVGNRKLEKWKFILMEKSMSYHK